MMRVGGDILTALLEYLDLEGFQGCTPMHLVEQQWRNFQPSAMFPCTDNAFTLKLGHSVPPTVIK